ncbi:hypothetical protein [Bradyrhizobium sp. SZCCHNRI2007]|uniref:hypothetical protein n=1 Tax=Bradyrhizobium sp. SZCCHNRI2007 TaxID=3057281 RepID=UPI0028EA0B1B|nr:hypothetical protein [Bradyrhizobium sp. SZCCHNRI2007]
MPSPFARVVAAAAMTHDRILGDLFTFAPQKYQTDRNAPLIADPARAIVEHVLCPFGEPAARAGAGAFEQVGVKPERAGHSTDRPYVSLDLSRLAWRPRIGDLLTQEATGRRFRIHEVLPSTPGFVRLTLNGI